MFGTLPLLAQIPSIVILSRSLPTSQAIFIVLLVLLGVSVVALIFAFTFLFIRICTKCVNFSCPFNSVSDDLVDSYLENNPNMKKAWLDSGYEETNEQK